MQPVVTPEEMAAVDAAAPEPVEVLIGRAGAATAREALRLLGGAYGRRVLVVAGKGNNGNDGRDAAARLARRGVRVAVVPAAGASEVGFGRHPYDLVIDAAYGTGFRGEYRAPSVCDVPVLAVDIPSGVDGLTGAVSGAPAPAVRTVTFGAHKPGLLLAPGRDLAGEVVVADIGLDVSRARAGALVVGPGLGQAGGTAERVRRLVAAATDLAVLVDGDGLTALGQEAADVLAGRSIPAVLTPHDGEFARLAGAAPEADRLAAARGLAARTGAIVLLKGPTTVVAHPDGRARLALEGDQRLATAGTGDVLSGCIGALLARGLDPFDAAAAGAWLHGTAGRHGPVEGLVASDVVEALPRAFEILRAT